MKKINCIIFLTLFCFTFSVQSQTLKAGEVIVDKKSTLEYDFYFVYYFSSEEDIDQPFIRVAFGDGVVDTVALLSQTEPLPGIRKLVYLATHVYAGISYYSIQVLDLVQLPTDLNNLENSQFCLYRPYTSVWMLHNPLYYNNKRPAFENDLLSGVFNDGKWMFDNRAVDPEGDSLFYYFINYAELDVNFFPSPLYPEYSLPLATDTIQINNSTGEILWNKPQSPGNYLIGMMVAEFSKFGDFLGRLDRFLIVEFTEEDIVTGSSSDVLKPEKFTLFPNPVSHELHISITGGFQNQPITLSVFNILGERLFEQRGFDPGKAVDVSGLASGTYILQLQSGEEVLARKFVVQR